MKATVLWMLPLIVGLAYIPVSDLLDLAAGSYDPFAVTAEGRRKLPRGVGSLIAWPGFVWLLTIGSSAVGSFVSSNFGKSALFTLREDCVELADGTVISDDDIAEIRMRMFRNDAVIELRDGRRLTFHPQFTRGGLDALEEKYSRKFSRGVFIWS